MKHKHSFSCATSFRQYARSLTCILEPPHLDLSAADGFQYKKRVQHSMDVHQMAARYIWIMHVASRALCQPYGSLLRVHMLRAASHKRFWKAALSPWKLVRAREVFNCYSDCLLKW